MLAVAHEDERLHLVVANRSALSDAALGEHDGCVVDAAVAALRARTGALDAAIQTLSADLDTAPALPPILLIEAEYERAQLRSEREWFEVLLGRLESGELEWLPSDSWR